MKLLLTLGHNSSAILVKDNKVLCGYEEERLSGVKSDSSFPVLSIKMIMDFFPDAKLGITEIYISHWFWTFELTENKYYRPKFLTVNFPNAKITSVDYYTTHHDLHAKSVWNFCDGDESGLTVVADGFGNFGECLSLYLDGTLQHRSYNVQYSLGMMYQYAIRYLGMKEHQDEYKLLGYEQQCTSEFKSQIAGFLSHTIGEVYNGLMAKTTMQKDMVKSLSETWVYWDTVFKTVDKTNNRANIAYFVQQVLERVMMMIVGRYQTRNIKVSGGVFYNVKLNNRILRYSTKFEANPLAGDQGCALGFTDVRYDNLFWGKRWDGVFTPSKYLIEDIRTKGYCEILSGAMEFGPRALGHTSTLALPTMENVHIINSINGRDTVMPMAPMVTKRFANTMFKDLDKVKKSKYFMIIAFDFKSINNEIRGAAHYDSDRDVYTGRIQLLDDDERRAEIVNHFGGILINTSLNAHGQPIIYDNRDLKYMKHIQTSHKQK